MMTPQEIQKKIFSRVKFGGYDMSMVDEFLDAVYADYSALYKDNAVLKSKMKVLIDKIEEYRSVDDAMRKTLLSAQNMANEIVANAQKQSDDISVKARAEVEHQISCYRAEAEQFKLKFEQAKREAEQLIDNSIRTCSSSMAMLETLKNELSRGIDITAQMNTQEEQRGTDSANEQKSEDNAGNAAIQDQSEMIYQAAKASVEQLSENKNEMEDTMAFEVQLNSESVNQ